ncbi:MAG: ATP-dependent metallopeptidase FtsH/Yme1/Tma family protein [Clostridia bacterium]|nr:ATP-dependent metallopeptidase FtsH/Yme1/Tma family protein [Clostridia bacterium]NCD01748.1 ATP-dependent metallopeptidase FtsH/Yme1/Tma family protein [Clostridia bacterium]
MLLLMGLVLTILLNSCINRFLKDTATQQISYTEFMQKAKDGKVKSITIDESTGQIIIYPNDSDTDRGLIQAYYTGIVSSDMTLTAKMEEYGVDMDSEIPTQASPIINFLLTWILPMLLIGWLLSMMMKRAGGGGIGGLGSMGKSRAKEYVPEGSKVTFKDVAGQDEAKDSLMEIVDYLNNPTKYRDIGAKLPKGALLVGPPGTGKTLLAKAVAGEAGVPFFSLAGSDFVEMFVGMGASRVRDLFKQAEAKSPCIIFIDEIDAIGKSRDNQLGSNDEREQTLNQLLAEMDGFDESKAVVVLAATNRPEVLDKALRRPGRFDRTISVTQPDKQGRIDILKVHSRKVKLDETVDLEAIALATSGASGADLANIINEAALRAVRMNRRVIGQDDLFESVEVIIAGQQRKNHIMSRDEREIVAFHEIGHALVAAKQKNTQPIQKITIIPRTSGALGYTMQMPEEERFLMKKSEMLEDLVTLLGGRAAEEVRFGSVTTGASNDIEKATDLARKMVTMYGMSSEFGMMGLEIPGSQYMDGRPVKTCADETMVKADEIVRQILEDAYNKAIEILKENNGILEKSAAFLLEKETISGKEFMEFIHEAEV